MFHCTLSVPSGLPPGTYKLEAFAIRNDTVASYAAQDIEAREVGMTAFISSLSTKYGTVYGLIAVVVAVTAGLLTSLVFKGGGGGH